ncbi:MAG: AAA family ATPase [Deltaproteobacteria bacterium]|nr:AAA family ATPase [Deltaproteobacteria bacterium]
MNVEHPEEIKRFYMEHLPGARLEANIVKAPCPFCQSTAKETQGTLVTYLDPESYFLGYFRCLNRCRPGGFALHFGELMGIDLRKVPGYDPDRDPYARDTVYPPKNMNAEVKRFQALLGERETAYFKEFGVSRATLQEMRIGYNGRYNVYPYFLEDGNCYAARCVFPGKEEDQFWHGDETFFSEEFRVFNVQDIDRCQNGSLFVTEGENGLLTLKELGFPGIAVPTAATLEVLSAERLGYVKHVFIVPGHTPEAYLSARSLATRLGFRARIIQWPSSAKRGYKLVDLAREKGKEFRAAVAGMIQSSKSFSPFSSVEKEHRRFLEVLDGKRGKGLAGLETGFPKLDHALDGIRGINIMGGQPKAGKSCFFMQVSTEMARKKTPVIYYDFENGREKIYTRTLCRLSRLSERELRQESPDPESVERLSAAQSDLKDLLAHFRVVTDRKLSPDIMRRQIDFIKHETRKDHVLVVVDSLHKLPFKSLSERRTGIDEWLRHMEAIRDEQHASFLVVSELSRGEGGHYEEKPDLGSFKESGDIEYSADNALILAPSSGPLSESVAPEGRKSALWIAASRENNPGKVADYALEYPYWGFREM